MTNLFVSLKVGSKWKCLNKVLLRKWIPCYTQENNGVCNSQMFVILWWDSEAASISCVHCFDLSLGYPSNFYHSVQCGVWEASSLIMCCCFLFLFFCWGKKNQNIHTPCRVRHVVYRRLTKGREVKAVTPGNVNGVPQYHSRSTGRIPK